VAVVSGASRGIGRAVALRLAAEGYDIGFCYRSDKAAAAEVEAEAARLGARCVGRACDITDEDAVTDFIDGVRLELGEIDALVTSAGIVRDGALATMSAEAWNEVLAVNLTGTFLMARAVTYRMMKRGSGSIVCVSSIAGVRGNAGQANYSASKSGINGFVRSLAKEAASFGVRANAVAPGFIETDMTAGLPERAQRKALASIGMRRFGTAEEVAETVAFLVGDRSSYITGQVIEIDGGMVL
jgi:3-oxoacyl-[acyl-carrier protein] reductase